MRRKVLSARKSNRLFKKRSGIKKTNVALHRGGLRLR